MDLKGFYSLTVEDRGRFLIDNGITPKVKEESVFTIPSQFKKDKYTITETPEGFECKQPKHKKHTGKVWNGQKKGWGADKTAKKYFSVTGNCSGTLKQWQEAMGINWIKNKKTLTQCVPPKYAEYIGKEFLAGK